MESRYEKNERIENEKVASYHTNRARAPFLQLGRSIREQVSFPGQVRLGQSITLQKIKQKKLKNQVQGQYHAQDVVQDQIGALA